MGNPMTESEDHRWGDSQTPFAERYWDELEEFTHDLCPTGHTLALVNLSDDPADHLKCVLEVPLSLCCTS